MQTPHREYRFFVCKRCGTHIDIRKKHPDGSLHCPQCKTIYRPRVTQNQALQPQAQISKRQPPMKKKWSKKKVLSLAAVVLLLFIMMGSCGNGNEDNVTAPTVQTNEASTVSSNTTAKVDQLIAQAKTDAESADGLALASEAWNWIVNFVPEWYSSNEIMEEAIYNGALVEYYFTGKNDIRAAVGTDTVQAVKYVYRGVETVTANSTQENIQQIKEGIKRASTTRPPTHAPTNKPKPTDATTLGERNALARAKSYLEYTSFSYIGLGKQLMYEGYTKEEAKYAVDNCGADWNEQAAKKAASYLEYSSFSRQGLLDQLKYEEFTDKQAQYAVKKVGY